jgi:hypothetical protein
MLPIAGTQCCVTGMQIVIFGKSGVSARAACTQRTSGLPRHKQNYHAVS